MVPTVGRIVHYHTGNGVIPGLVTAVHEHKDANDQPITLVHLTIFPVLGGQAVAADVPEGTEVGQWSWPDRVA